MCQFKTIAPRKSEISIPFAPRLKITLYQLHTRWYISKNNHYVIITTGTVSLPASLLVVSMGKAFHSMPPSLCDKKVMGPSSLPVMVAQSDERHANRA